MIDPVLAPFPANILAILRHYGSVFMPVKDVRKRFREFFPKDPEAQPGAARHAYSYVLDNLTAMGLAERIEGTAGRKYRAALGDWAGEIAGRYCVMGEVFAFMQKNSKLAFTALAVRDALHEGEDSRHFPTSRYTKQLEQLVAQGRVYRFEDEDTGRVTYQACGGR